LQDWREIIRRTAVGEKLEMTKPSSSSKRKYNDDYMYIGLGLISSEKTAHFRPV